jgi:hypothetical protein
LFVATSIETARWPHALLSGDPHGRQRFIHDSLSMIFRVSSAHRIAAALVMNAP